MNIMFLISFNLNISLLSSFLDHLVYIEVMFSCVRSFFHREQIDYDR